MFGAAAGAIAALPFLHNALEPGAWVALVPLLALLASGRVGRGLAAALAAGLAYVATGVFWLWQLSSAAVALTALLFGPYFLALAIIPFMRRRMPMLPLWAYVPVLWAFMESLREHVTPYQTTWLNVGYTQAQALPLVQLAEWTGVYGVTVLVVLANAALAELSLASGPVGRWKIGACPSRRVRVWGLGLAILLPLGVSAWGFLRMSQVRAVLREGPRVLLVQGNIRPGQKTPRDAAQALLDHVRLTREASRESRPDLVVWPETMPLRPEHPDDHLAAEQVASRVGRPLLLGGMGVPKSDAERRYSNSAFLLAPDGRPLVRYDKQVLVPFGEYVPFVDGIPFLRRAVEQYVWERFGFVPFLQAGTESTLFPLEHDGRPLRIAVLICYEDVLPDLTDRFVRKGADILLVISNEHFYFPREMDQHLDMAVFRAIETRRPVLRATNTGLTATIDPTGAITARLERDTQGTMAATVPLASVSSSLRHTAGIFGLLCGIVLAGMLAVALGRRRAPP